MARLPIPGGDVGNWGEVLNEYLLEAHNTDGTLKENVISLTNVPDGELTEEKLDTAVRAKINSMSGVTDHGAFIGLGDDDHPQYHNDARGDARYYTQAQLNTGQLDTRYYTETEVDSALSSKSNVGHTHTGVYATAAQGALAASAVQPGDLAPVATSGAYADLSGAPGLSTVATTGAYSDLSGRPTLGTAADNDEGDFATAAQGTLADSAVQPADLSAVATSGAYADLSGTPSFSAVATTGAYSDLTGTPTLGTAADNDEGDFATAAQGALADTALQDAPVDGSQYARQDGAWAVVTASGVSDHGLLTGLGDDDHLQYHTDARGDARYYTQSQVDTALASKQDQPAEGAFVDGDKTKLDGIAAGAQVNTVDSVNGQTGAVSIDPDDLDDSLTTNKFATAAQLSAADSAVQPGDLATVATTGAYSDLTGAPSFAAVATSGSYADLSGTPTLGTAADNDESDFAPAGNYLTAVQGPINDPTDTYVIDDPTNQRVGRWDIEDDLTPTAGWPDRFGFRFKPNGGSARVTGYFNEYGEIRAQSAKDNTTAMRAMGTGASSGTIFDVLDDRGGNELFAISSANQVVQITNNDRLVNGLIVNRTDPAQTTSDPDIVQFQYLSQRRTWVNEKGMLRVGGNGADVLNEDTFKIITDNTPGGNSFVITREDGTIVTRVGALGRFNFNFGTRHVGDTAQFRDATEANESTIGQVTGGDLEVRPANDVDVIGGSLKQDGNPVVVGQSTGVTSIVQLTQAEYDLLTPDANTLYVIVG